MIAVKQYTSKRDLTEEEIKKLKKAGMDAASCGNKLGIHEAFEIAYSIIEDTLSDSALHSFAAEHVYRGMCDARGE